MGCVRGAMTTSRSRLPSASCWHGSTHWAAAARDAKGASERLLEVDNLRMDLLSRKVQRGPRAIVLQPREFKLLEYLMRHADQVVTRTMLLENVWEYSLRPPDQRPWTST